MLPDVCCASKILSRECICHNLIAQLKGAEQLIQHTLYFSPSVGFWMEVGL